MFFLLLGIPSATDRGVRNLKFCREFDNIQLKQCIKEQNVSGYRRFYENIWGTYFY